MASGTKRPFPGAEIKVYESGQPSQDMFCAVCRDIFIKPVMLHCGHTFCTACVSQALSSRRRCPLCRMDCPESSTAIPNYSMQNIVGGLRVYCRWGLREEESGLWVPDASGCQATVRLSEKVAHESTCEHAWVSCPYSSSIGDRACEFESWRPLVEDHKRSCSFQPTPCQNMGCPVCPSQNELEEHMRWCEFRPQQCENSGCTEIISRANAQEHRAECPKQIIFCQFSGCNARFPREQRQSHNRMCVDVHLAGENAARTSLEARVEFLENNQRRSNEQIQELYRTLSTLMGQHNTPR